MTNTPNAVSPNRDAATIESIEFALGEHELSYRETPGYEKEMIENKIADMPQVLGLGKFRRTDRDIFDLGIDSARKTLMSSGLEPQEIDFLIFCSTRIPGSETEHISHNVRLLKELGLTNAYPIGVTLNNCSSFMSAIVMAAGMLSRGCCTNVLIVTADKVNAGCSRFTNFALLSDSAASCIVTSRPTSGYRLKADKFGVSKGPVDTFRGKDDPSLYEDVLAALLRSGDTSLKKIRKVFCSNVFRPITTFREKKLGFTTQQLFLDNVDRRGHCFSADAFMNLIDHSASGAVSAGDLFVLTADAPNLRSSILLERVGTQQ
jgi:3-oxoacyl-[acyl-carrier-protein] synthase-3